MSKEKEEIDKLAKEKANELFEERLDFYMHKQGFDEGFNSALQESIRMFNDFAIIIGKCWAKQDFELLKDEAEKFAKKIEGLKK